MVLVDAGQPALERHGADRVAVADVDQHGVGELVAQGAEQGRRAGVGGRDSRQSRELAGRRPQARELGRHLVGGVEELLERRAGGQGALPDLEAEDAVGAARAEAVVLGGDAAAREARSARRGRRAPAAGPSRSTSPDAHLGGAAAQERRAPRRRLSGARRGRPPVRGRRRRSARRSRSPRRRDRRRGGRASPWSRVRRPWSARRTTTGSPRRVASRIWPATIWVREGTTSLTEFSGRRSGSKTRMSVVPVPTSRASKRAGVVTTTSPQRVGGRASSRRRRRVRRGSLRGRTAGARR